MIINLYSFLDVFAKNPPFAYLDPGTGSLIIQFLIGGAAAAAISIKVFWKQIRGFFSKKRDDKEEK